MRILKTLAALAVLLLAAGSASASYIFYVRAASPDDGNADIIDVEVDIELVNEPIGVRALNLSFVHNGTTAAGDASTTCSGTTTSYGCDWNSMAFVGGHNSGAYWSWESPDEGPSADGVYADIAHFITMGATGEITLGDVEVIDINWNVITDVTVIPYAIPEPTTAALLGLGFVGLALSRRRGPRQA